MPSRTESCHSARSRGRRPGRRRAGCRREPRGRTWLRRTTQPVASTGPLRPHARDAPVARGAAAVRADALPLDHVAETLDEEVAAVGAPGVLPAPHPAGKVAGVNELQAGRGSDL